MNRTTLLAGILTGAAILGWAARADATVLRQTCDFQLETWCDINQTDGPVTLHRFRVTTTDIGIRSISASNVLNRDYLQRIGVQVEFTNEGDKKYKSYVKVRWLDAEETAIDGFGDEEGFEGHKTRGMMTRSIPALKFGLKQAKKIEIEVNLNP